MRYTDDAAILLAAALAGGGGGGGSSGLRIQVESDTTVDNWDVPNMTVEDVTAAHDALAVGKAVSIVNAAGEVTFTAFLADISTGKPCITVAYYWLGFVDYQVTANDTVDITVHKTDLADGDSVRY